jgi:hypothetical protein
MGLNNPITDQQFKWMSEMMWNNPSLAQVPPKAFRSMHGGEQSGNKDAWLQGAPGANHDATGARNASSHRAAKSGAAKDGWQQGLYHGNPGSAGKRSTPTHNVQAWDGQMLGAYHPTAAQGTKGAPQQGVELLPFMGFAPPAANNRPTGSRGQKTKKSNAPAQTDQTVFTPSSRASSSVSFNLNTPGAGYPSGVALQCPANGPAANRSKNAARNPAHASQNAAMEIDPQLLMSANEIYHEYFLQQLNRGAEASAPSRPSHPPTGSSGAPKLKPANKPSEFDGGEAEQMSKEIVDPFQLLAALWSMVPAVEDPKNKRPVGRRGGADAPGANRPAPGDDHFKNMPQSDSMRRYEVPSSSCTGADKALSLTDTKSTKSGSGDGSGFYDDETPPGSHRSSPSIEAKDGDCEENHEWAMIIDKKNAPGSSEAKRVQHTMKKYASEAEASTKSGSGGGSGSSDTQSGSHRSSPSVEAKDADSETNEDNKKSSHENGLMVMICNLPNNRHAEDVLEVLEGLGYSGKYDYFYLPVDRHCMCNKGYGFVHFIRIHDAYSFMERLEGYRFDHTSSTKALTACVAKRQSVYASLRACMKTPHRLLDGKARGRLMSHHPWLYVNGEYRCLSPSSAYKAYQRMQDSFSGE